MAQQDDELEGAAEAAASSAELAANNIRKYVELHAGVQARFVMKIVDETAEAMSRISDQSAELAANNLRTYLEHRRR